MHSARATCARSGRQRRASQTTGLLGCADSDLGRWGRNQGPRSHQPWLGEMRRLSRLLPWCAAWCAKSGSHLRQTKMELQVLGDLAAMLEQEQGRNKGELYKW